MASDKKKLFSEIRTNLFRNGYSRKESGVNIQTGIGAGLFGKVDYGFFDFVIPNKSGDDLEAISVNFEAGKLISLCLETTGFERFIEIESGHLPFPLERLGDSFSGVSLSEITLVHPQFKTLEEYVAKAVVADIMVSAMKKKADPNIYQLNADFRIKGKCNGVHYGLRVILDGEYAFELAVGYDPVCVVAFYLENGRMNIKQIQGVKGQKLRLRDFKHFEDALVLIAEDYARQTKLSEVSIRPAAENGWVKAGKISLERALDHYDRTAKRNEYVYDKERKLFVKQVTQALL